MTRAARASRDFAGGAVAGVLGLPEAMAYALVAFAPLGASFAGAAVVSGLTALCCINLGASLTARHQTILSGPYSLAAVLLGGTLSTLLQQGHSAGHAVALLFAVVWCAGLLQVALGLLKLGDLGRYIPQPVLAGLLNGTSLWILAAQVEPLLELRVDHSAPGTESSLEWALPWTLAVGAITLATTTLAPRVTTRFPAPLIGLCAGTAAHHALANVLGAQRVGSLAEAVPRTLPSPEPLLKALDALTSLHAIDVLRLVPFAAALALVASLRSLISVAALDHRYATRTDRSRELVSQGVGNFFSGALGGITGAGSVTLTVASREQGGAGRVARVAAGLTALGVLVALGPLVHAIPRAAIAAVVVMLCLRTFDRWSLELLLRLLKGHAPTRASGADLLIMLVVAGVMVGIGTFEAVVVGVVISVALLLHRMGMNVVRRTWRGGEMLSNVRRAGAELESLAQHGAAIRVLELEGSLFFGTADALLEAIDATLAEGAEWILVDLQRITSLDSTGAFALLRAQGRCRDAGRELLLSSTRSRGLDRALLRSMGVLNPAQDALSFHDLTTALAYAEDRLLDRVLQAGRYSHSVSLSAIDALAALSPSELEDLEPYLKTEDYADGELVCRQTEPGDRVHFIEHGRARVSLWGTHHEDEMPLGTLCPGTTFGEMALLDRGPRSASVRAEGPLRCRVLHLNDFERLAAERPALALQVLRGIGRELSDRMRTANRMASVLRD